jgi:predicted TPR repeat methyltransferase
MTKAQTTLRDVKDQKTFLYNIHQNQAESYDIQTQKREFSNKLGQYRKTLLSYADGQVLEMGVGTGVNLPFYTSRVTGLVGVDWSDNMLLKAF